MIKNNSNFSSETIFKKPTAKEAEEAVKTLIAWAGDDPNREGLIETPKRVINSYSEFFSGYNSDPLSVLSKTFDNVEEYDDIVLLKNMRLESHCEHHMAPFIGYAHVAYLPHKRVVGISKIARVVDIFSKRLQTQENMTAQIADTIYKALKPRGVAVLVNAEHQCMTTRGTSKPGTTTTTTRMLGEFKNDSQLEKRFFSMINCL